MIIKATLSDAEKLTEIAIKSKAHWGYTNAQIESWREDLTVTEKLFQQREIYKYVSENEIIGFYILNLEYAKDTSDLQFLFISPNAIGKGVGARMLNHAFQLAIENHKELMNVLSDPNAATFYAKYGFVEIAREKSSIPGRFLPIMQKELL